MKVWMLVAVLAYLLGRAHGLLMGMKATYKEPREGENTAREGGAIEDVLLAIAEYMIRSAEEDIRGANPNTGNAGMGEVEDSDEGEELFR